MLFSKIKSIVSKTYVFALLLAALAFGGGFQTAHVKYQVTPVKLQACAEDVYLNILSQVAMFAMMGATKEDLLKNIDPALPAEVKVMIDKAIATVFAPGANPQKYGMEAYAECLNRV